MKLALAIALLALIALSQAAFLPGPGCSSAAQIKRRDSSGEWQDEQGRINNVYDITVQNIGNCTARAIGLSISIPAGWVKVESWNLEFQSLYVVLTGFGGYLQAGTSFHGAGLILARPSDAAGGLSITVYATACDSSCWESTGEDSEYPPESSSEYPPDASSEYPPESSSEYPPDESSEYPPDASSEYPPESSSEYPPDESSEYPPDASSEYPPESSSEYPDSSSEYPPENSSEEEPEPAHDCDITAIVQKNVQGAWRDAEGRENAVYDITVTNTGSSAATSIKLSLSHDGVLIQKWNLDDNYNVLNFGGSLAAGDSYSSVGVILAGATNIEIIVADKVCENHLLLCPRC